MNMLKYKTFYTLLLPAVFTMILVMLSCSTSKENQMTNDGFTLEVLEPHGELAFAERQGLFAPRLRDLNGKKIAIMAMGFRTRPTFLPK
jgi:hypothetical protein